MTVAKSKNIAGRAHMVNAEFYADDERAVLFRTHNIFNRDNWKSEITRIQNAYGHNVPGVNSTRGVNLGFHDILAFAPAECDLNGGNFTAEDAMDYAERYLEEIYPDQQGVLALHRETSKAADGSTFERYAVHAIVSRSVLSTGKRFNRSKAVIRKVHDVKAALDKQYGLAEVVRGQQADPRFTRTGETEKSKESMRRNNGSGSYKSQLIKTALAELKLATNTKEFAAALKEHGIATRVKNGERYYEILIPNGETRTFNGFRLGNGLDNESVKATLIKNRKAHKQAVAEQAEAQRKNAQPTAEQTVAPTHEKPAEQNTERHGRGDARIIELAPEASRIRGGNVDKTAIFATLSDTLQKPEPIKFDGKPDMDEKALAYMRQSGQWLKQQQTRVKVLNRNSAEYRELQNIMRDVREMNRACKTYLLERYPQHFKLSKNGRTMVVSNYKSLEVACIQEKFNKYSALAFAAVEKPKQEQMMDKEKEYETGIGNDGQGSLESYGRGTRPDDGRADRRSDSARREAYKEAQSGEHAAASVGEAHRQNLGERLSDAVYSNEKLNLHNRVQSAQIPDFAKSVENHFYEQYLKRHQQRVSAVEQSAQQSITEQPQTYVSHNVEREDTNQQPVRQRNTGGDMPQEEQSNLSRLFDQKQSAASEVQAANKEVKELARKQELYKDAAVAVRAAETKLSIAQEAFKNVPAGIWHKSERNRAQGELDTAQSNYNAALSKLENTADISADLKQAITNREQAQSKLNEANSNWNSVVAAEPGALKGNEFIEARKAEGRELSNAEKTSVLADFSRKTALDKNRNAQAQEQNKPFRPSH